LHTENTVISHDTGALGTIQCSLEEPNLGLPQNYLRGVKILVQLQSIRAGLAEPDKRHSPRWVNLKSAGSITEEGQPQQPHLKHDQGKLIVQTSGWHLMWYKKPSSFKSLKLAAQFLSEPIDKIIQTRLDATLSI